MADILKLGRAKYSLPQRPDSLSQAVEPATLEPSRAGEVLRIDSILRAPDTSVEEKPSEATNVLRAPQLDTDDPEESKVPDYGDSVTLVATSVEETK
jgi:hypothetical protein